LVCKWVGKYYIRRISIDPSVGVKLKHRFTATGNQNDMSMLLIDTTTTLTAQKDNFYPIDQDTYNFKFTLQPSITNYEWRIYEIDAIGSLTGAVELAGGETASIDNQTYTYTYISDTPIALQIISQPNTDYVESTTFYTLSNSDQNTNILLDIDINN